MDNLIRRGMIIPNRCCLCMADAESSGHLFIHCAWVRPLWCYFLSHFDVNWAQPSSVRSLLECCQRQVGKSGKEVGKATWKAVPAAICRVVWDERNRRTFDNKSRPSHVILDAILAKLYDWVFVSQKWERPTFTTWIYDWHTLIL